MIVENALIRKDTLKCQSYETTINQIENAFDRLGLKLSFQKSFRNPKLSCYSCIVKIPELNVTTAGKGTTKKQSIASALAEMVERFSADFLFKYLYPAYEQISDKNIIKLNNGEHLPGYIHGHQNELNDYLPINDLFRNYHIKFSLKQIEELTQLDIAQHWVDGYSLLNNKKMKIPLRLIKDINGSNGLASGNTLEEAIVQASCEIFERYAKIEVFRNKLIVPTIDTATIKDNIIQKMIKYYEKHGINILIKDFTMNNLMPAMGVVFINPNISNKETYNYQFEHIRISNGSSFDINEAIKRCFTERIAGLTFNKSLEEYVGNFDQTLEVLNKKVNIDETFYAGLTRKSRYGGDKTFLLEGEKRPCPDFKTSNDFLEYIEQIKGICKKLNTDFIIIDHTHPIIQFPTVRVIIPGISDTLNYKNYNFEAIKNMLVFGVEKLEAKEKYSPEYTIATEEDLHTLEKIILNEHLILGDNLLGNKSNELNSAKDFRLLLSSIYFRKANYEKFEYLAGINAKNFSGKIGRNYKYLQLLTRYFLKTKQEEYLPLIKEFYENMPGCYRYLTDPSNNPYTDWCDQPCEKNCEKKYRQSLNKAVRSFFSKESPS
ncbi:MAG TPA: YcaO-like family protein [Candidatus Bathyarchaeia archaeon]|nr:YcaO-like family protein [Candidatus Bathyarchaeia archaeon]